jgi:two-component system, OmpR family, phosphate regulon sensor histidine kinase PhoR
MLGAGALLAGVPAITLILLVALGWLPAGASLLAIGATLLAALLLVVLWSRDLDRLSAYVRRLGAEPSQQAPLSEPFLPGLSGLAHDLQRAERRIATQAVAAERLGRADTTVVDRLPDPLIVLAADHSVRRTNAAARAAFGEDMPAVLRHPDLRAAIDRAVSLGVMQMAEVTLSAPVPREVHATVVPMEFTAADGGQAVVVLSDRSREHAVERTRADFVANVSHELRTPLASLIGFIDTLRGPAADDPSAQQRFLGIMAEQAARMNRLIDDLLNLSRIELVEHQAPSDAVALRELVARLMASYSPRLRERAVSLDLRMPDDLPAVIGDADQLTQVLQNLLDNAVKYGREGGTVRIEIAEALPGVQWPARPGVVVSVADQGVGIPRAHLPRLTERFYRVDAGRSRAAGGTGLGLAIVKHIVNRHRGQLLIESEEGVGTTVSVWLQQMSRQRAAAD